MAATHGKSQTLVYNSNTYTPYITGGGVSFPRETEILETTAAGDNSRTYIKGLNGSTVSVELLMDDVVLEWLETAYAHATGAFTFTYKPDGVNQLECSAIVSNLNYDAPIGLNSISVDFQVTGDVSKS